MKKVLIISLVLLFFTLLFLGVYNFAFKKDIAETLQETAQTSTENAANAFKKTVDWESEKIYSISEQPVMGPLFDKKNETIFFYSADDGTVWSVDPDGKGRKKISDTVLPNLKDVFWFSGGSKVLTKIEKDGRNYFYEYNHKEGSGADLKSGTDSVAWDYTGAKIFYKYYDEKTKKKSLNISNPDGSNWQHLADIEFKDVSIAPIPLTSTVSYWNSPDAFYETRLQTVSLVGGQPQTIFIGRFGADYLWSPDGTQALVSSLAEKEDKMVSLGILTAEGEYKELNIPTLVSKCVWSFDGRTVFYALPGGIPYDAVMPNDYQSKKFMTEDTFWKMDIATNQKERIVETKEIKDKYDSSNLFLSATQDALYFVNRIDRKLYKIEL